jgi:hypothetical protein
LAANTPVHTQPFLGAQPIRHQQQRLIHGADQQVEHPQGDRQRHPNQEPGQQVAFEEITFGHGIHDAKTAVT